EQAVRDGLAARHLLFGPVLVDMDPLLVAGRFRELGDAILRDVDPVARPDFGADRCLDLVEAVEYPHGHLLRIAGRVRSSFPEPGPGSTVRPPSPPALPRRGRR